MTVGSQTNLDEEGLDAKEPRRAAILEVNSDGSGMRIFASGLRNPNGRDWAPDTNMLWTVVNERDGLGDDLVLDFLDLVAKAVVSDFALGAHTASLGLIFYRGTAFPERYRGGAFISQHGSWNRSRFAGYKVVFVPFKEGKPTGEMEDFLTGFIADEQKSEVYGRPVRLAVLSDGSLLVSDDGWGRKDLAGEWDV